MFFKNLIYFLYPKKCILCMKKIGENSTYACEKCSNIIKYTLINEACNLNFNMYFDKLISLFLYKGMIRKRILEFKFNNRHYMGRLFAKIISDFLAKTDIKADMIIPVPMYYKRFFERGYNQSSILAKYVAKDLKIKYTKNVLIKIKKSAVQSTLNLNQRKVNVLNTYGVINKRKVFNKNIILIDDVFTTGATVNECSRVLKEAGTNKIYVVTIAHGKFGKEEFKWTN